MTGTEEIHAAWYGALSTAGIFDPAVLDNEEKAALAGNRHNFWFGEIASAAALAGAFTIPPGMFLAGKCGSLPAFTITAIFFLLLFVFLPKIIRKGMKTNTDTIILQLGKNKQVKKVFWNVFIMLTGIVLAQVVDPKTAKGNSPADERHGMIQIINPFFTHRKKRIAAGVHAAYKKNPGLRIVQKHPEFCLDMRRYLVIPGLA
jgi:hypothetical protein